VLAPLRARGITPAWGHYGALRGRNDWRHADALVCLGTPYPPVAEIEQIAAAAELHDAIRDVGLHEARAEIEQAVARLRAPQRTTPTAVVVLATVPPLHADARWKVRALATGRPSTADDAELLTLAERMGIADAAAAAGVSERTVQRARARARARAQVHTPNGGVTEGVAEAPTTGCVTPPSGPPPPIATHVSQGYSPPLRSTVPDDDPPTVASARCGGCALAPSRASPRVATG
jgi:DNA-directed RNA polymerase specialized sigma24 family protein